MSLNDPQQITPDASEKVHLVYLKRVKQMDNVIICKKCHLDQSQIINSRKVKGIVLRRRECGNCGFRWTTAEVNYWYLKMLEDKGAQSC